MGTARKMPRKGNRNDQIPPDFVVKTQAIDIVEVIA
jgi:hypothetical protein